MNIEDFYELNALHKLLFKVKFEEDLDFYEFKEFVSSPIINSIFTRLRTQYINESLSRDFLKENEIMKFEINGSSGKSIRKRIDELSDSDKEVLIDNGSISELLKNLIAPLEIEPNDFNGLLSYAVEKVQNKG